MHPSASNVTPCWETVFAFVTTLLPRMTSVIDKCGLQSPIDTLRIGGFDRGLVARIRMTHDAHPAIRRQHAFQAFASVVRAVGDHHHSGMQAVSDADAAAVMERHPVRARRSVE